MGQNLTGQLISATYESLVQISGSIITDGTGSDITSLNITASNAVNALSANSASVATSASFANTSISSSYALTASFALNGGGATVDTGSLMVTGSATNNVLTFTKGDGSTFNLTVNTGSAVTVDTGSFYISSSVNNATITFTQGDGSTEAVTVNNVSNASTASIATSASHALNANNSISSSYALTASFALNAGTTVDTGSLMVTGSVAGNVLTFTKGNASTFSLTVDTGSAGTTPDLQSVTSVGSTTSASISITDGGNLMVHNEGGNADLIVTSDGSNTYNSTIRLGGGAGGGGNGFYLEMLPGDIASLRSDGGLITLNNNTQVTGSLNISGGASGSFSGSFQGDGSGLTGVVASAFPFTGSARITGSLIITGSQNMLSTNPLTGNRIVDIRLGNNTVTNVPQRFVVRNYDTVTRTTNVADANMVWAGPGNVTLSGYNVAALGIGTVNSIAYQSAILATDLLTNTIGDTNTSLIAGTYNCTVVGLQRGAVIGTENTYGQGQNTAVIGGRNHWMYDLDGSAQVNRSVILGGTGITASLSDAVYVPTLVVSGSIQGYKSRPINISGSIVNITGSTNITGSLTVRGDYNRVSGSFSGSVIDNITDIYTSTAAIEHVISLTQAQYNAISSSADPNTLYYITDAPSPVATTSTLQEVTTAGATTSASISITDGGELYVDNQTGNATLIVTNDGSNTYNSTIRLGGGTAGGGNAFYLEMLPGDIASLRNDGGLITLGNNTQVTGSVSISSVMNLAPQDPLPTGNFGDIAVSGSSGAANVYFYDGTAWVAMI